VIGRIERIAGRKVAFHECDVRDAAALRGIFREHAIDAVLHFAGLKAVDESVAQPLRYYDNNVGGTLALCEAMAEAGVRQLVFSSSATVYGDPEAVPVREDHPLRPTNPYGRSKAMVEAILQDLFCSDPAWKIALLRYFNPVGAHESGLIGEDPGGVPNNLMPYIAQVAVGRREALNVYGNDYPTPDGTGVRDYIHVVDLARGHLAALEKLTSPPRSAHGESRHGARLQRAGDGRGVPPGLGPGNSLSDRCATPGRCRRLLCRPRPGRPPARLACRARP
jgi:UDP-glucose 4-epimerase